MFKNYLKIAARHLVKQKMYSAVKIGGFALSIAACLLIALAQVSAHMDALIAQGKGEWDHSAIPWLIQELAGIK